MHRSENKVGPKKIAIFASGRGSNARAILDYFKNDHRVSIEIIISNNSRAGVLQLADEFGSAKMVINRKQFYSTTEADTVLLQKEIDLIVLAGFLWLIPERLVQKYPSRIVNIHPALLPKYGGKGMYGENVHKAVKKAGDLESGITIHLIDQEYDKGKSVFQISTPLNETDTPEEIASKVLKLEHYHYPRIIEQILFA